MAELNKDITTLDLTTKVGKLYEKLYNYMVEAQKAVFPDMSQYIDASGNVDEAGINKASSEYADILMKNSAYNTAKSIVDTMGADDGAGLKLFAYTRNDKSMTDETAISNALGGVLPTEGTVVIITDTDVSSAIKYAYTGFAYHDGAWCNMNGRVDASNVIMRGNIILAGNYSSVGNISKGDSTTSTLETDGKSVADVINEIFSKTIEPTVVTPSVSFNASIYAGSVVKEAEIGTKFKPSWKAIFNPGSYSFNPTNVKDSAYLIKNDAGDTVGNLSEGTATTEVQLTDLPMMFNVSVSYTAGDKPMTNMGKESTSVQSISAGSCSASSIIKSYRNIFYGYDSSVDLNSSVIRALSYKKSAAGNIDFQENINASRIIVAIPKGTCSISKVIMPSSSNAEVTTEFIKQTVSVYGANGYAPIDYDVYVYAPAKMAGTYQITIV